MQGQVKIGPRFFAKAKNDYRDWRWAFARESMQNSLDAPGTGRIEIWVEREGEDTRVTWSNDGELMTRDVLVNRLLALGESGKDFQGSVGGFGKAKELLYLMAKSYSIHTGDLLVQGEGAGYTIEQNGVLPGTRSSVLLEGDQYDSLLAAYRRFCQLAQRDVVVELNGEGVPTNLRKGTPRREFEWGKVYTNRAFSNLLVLRIQGTPMFTRPTAFRGCVVVELTGNSGERLSANRDSLLWSIGEELDAFLIQLAVDKKSALRQKRAEIKRYEGDRLRNEAKKPKAVGNLMEVLVTNLLEEDQATAGRLAAFVRGGEVQPGAGIATEVVAREEVRVSIGPEFLLKNTTGMVTPDYYTPGPKFSDYSRKLALAWAACLLELHRVLELPGEFSIGFCLDEDSAAEYDRSAEYGVVYYINPARVVCQRDKPQCRSFRAAFAGAWANRFEIIALALHEITHGLGLPSHDEDYSSKLTELTGRALAHLGRFTPLFRS